MGTGGGMQRWKSAEGTAEDVVEKDKLPLKNYAFVILLSLCYIQLYYSAAWG